LLIGGSGAIWIGSIGCFWRKRRLGMASWVVVVDCEDDQEAKETAYWLAGQFDWVTWVEERD
jgi:hypothetical protein